MEAALLQSGEISYRETMFTPNGPAGIFALYILPSQKIGWAFLNEFVNVSPLEINQARCTHTNLRDSVSSSPSSSGLASTLQVFLFLRVRLPGSLDSPSQYRFAFTWPLSYLLTCTIQCCDNLGIRRAWK